MRYFEKSSQDQEQMLQAIKRNNIAELFSSIPLKARLKVPLKLPKPLSELELKRLLSPFCAPAKEINFLGAGATQHFVPEWVSQQLLRSEWYTSYTPYQPEVSQGTLQAIFEFQSITASLFGLKVANASMYDGATALMESLLMAVRLKRKSTVILSQAIHPEYIETVKTYLGFAKVNVILSPFDDHGVTNGQQLCVLIEEHKNDLAAIAVQSPNFLGIVEDIKEFAEKAHKNLALFIGCTTDMTSTAKLSSFGECGVDIAVGEGLGLAGGLQMGGPGCGLFATKMEFLRQMPGRLVGMAEDRKGNLGFVLTLSTREQHIRREKATSNICTNHNLMALGFLMTLAAYGKKGFVNLAKANVKKTLYFRKLLQGYKMRPKFLGPHYNETVIDLGQEKILKQRTEIALSHGLIAGLDLGRFFPSLKSCLMVATTELHQDKDINLLAKIISGEHNDA